MLVYRNAVFYSFRNLLLSLTDFFSQGPFVAWTAGKIKNFELPLKPRLTYLFIPYALAQMLNKCFLQTGVSHSGEKRGLRWSPFAELRESRHSFLLSLPSQNHQCRDLTFLLGL